MRKMLFLYESEETQSGQKLEKGEGKVCEIHKGCIKSKIKEY